jgi:hypothetical protein
MGKARLVFGRIHLSCSITQETNLLSFGFLHLNDHNLFGGVRKGQSDDAYQQMRSEITRLFTDADFPRTICSLDHHLGGLGYSLRSLFRDEQRKILNQISQMTLSEAEAMYRQLYENHTPLLRFLTDLGVPLTVLSVPLPRALQTAAEFVINIDLRRALEVELLDPNRIRALMKQAHAWHVVLDTPGLGYLLKGRLEKQAEALQHHPADLDLLRQLVGTADLARELPFEVDLFRVQNVCYEILHNEALAFREQAARGDEEARAWLDQFMALADRLCVQAEGLAMCLSEAAPSVPGRQPPPGRRDLTGRQKITSL